MGLLLWELTSLSTLEWGGISFFGQGWTNAPGDCAEVTTVSRQHWGRWQMGVS